MPGLSQQKARIFRITHVDNVPWILANGLCCQNLDRRDPGFREIGHPELIQKRARRAVPIRPGGTLSDYIPFYFTPHSPMLYNIKTGAGVPKLPMREIAILVSALTLVRDAGVSFVFTDRHAYLLAAQFYSDLADLSHIDWALLNRRDFKRDPNDLGKFERYQAEALVHSQLPVNALYAVACFAAEQKGRLEMAVAATRANIRVLVKPDWYF
jgi:hypothetical protein